MNAARKEIAAAMGVDPAGLYFTSGGTEANNLALIGGAEARKRRGSKIVVSAYEHDSVMKSAKYLEENGFFVEYVFPNEEGVITPEAVFASGDEKTPAGENSSPLTRNPSPRTKSAGRRAWAPFG